MTPHRFLLVSPREPSGATWLLNCLLELGVRVHRDSASPMWIADGDGWTLSPHEEILKKWLPSLGLRPRFRFRKDLELRWTHEWPSAATQGQPLLLFVRDPRDALFSRWKREASELSFEEFLAFPDPRTLLDKPDHWRLHLRCWLAGRPSLLLRFEDYRRDAAATLRKALAGMGIEAGDDEVTRAVEASTFERAAAGERAYRAAHPEDRQLINRGGVPGEWRGLPDYEAQMRGIAARCGDAMSAVGYEPSPRPDDVAGDGAASGFAAHARLLAFFERLPPDVLAQAAAGPGNAESLGRTLAFALQATPQLMERARLPAHETAALAASLAEYLARLGRQAPDNLRDAGLGASASGQTGALAPARALVRWLGGRRP